MTLTWRTKVRLAVQALRVANGVSWEIGEGFEFNLVPIYYRELEDWVFEGIPLTDEHLEWFVNGYLEAYYHERRSRQPGRFTFARLRRECPWLSLAAIWCAALIVGEGANYLFPNVITPDRPPYDFASLLMVVMMPLWSFRLLFLKWRHRNDDDNRSLQGGGPQG